MKWSTAVFHNYFQDRLSLLSTVCHESFFSARFLICVTCGEWDVCFSSGESDSEWFRGAFGWPQLLTFSSAVLLSRSGASEGMLIYLSLPPGKAAPLFPTWGWTHGVIRQAQVRILNTAGGVTWLGIDSINFSRQWQGKYLERTASFQ